MIEKAVVEGIVVRHSTFYDCFFVRSGESKSKTVACLPYFDGDYWSGVAKELLVNIEKDMKKSVTKTSLKVMGLQARIDAHTKDVLLMNKLGEAMLPYKEDFMVIDLQYVCTNCHESILSGKRWYCTDNKKLHLCERCHAKKSLISTKGKRQLSQVPVDVRSDTTDEDGMLDISFCSSRENFVEFFQTNSLQFNTVRRAKHSTMMLLYKILSMETSCRICQKEIVGQKWSCEICSMFNVCSACHQEKGSSCHDHKLSPPIARVALSEEEKIELLKIVKHSCECCATEATPCTFRGCKQLKGMFRHWVACNIQADGGCIVCHRVWYGLRCHSRQCADQICHVPFCKDLKKREQRSLRFRIIDDS